MESGLLGAAVDAYPLEDCGACLKCQCAGERGAGN
jgi:hypothetical protein